MKRNAIWLNNLDPTIGAEIKKIRPAVIVNDDNLGLLPLRIVIPITDWKERYSEALWMVKINPNNSTNLSKESSADCFQIRSVSKDRFIRRLGKVSDFTMIEIQQALLTVLKIDQ